MDGQRKTLSQFDGMETLKSAHEDGNQTLRTSNGLSSIPPQYSRTDITYNVQGSITHIDFYNGTMPEIREVRCVADLLGSLDGSYFVLYSNYDTSKYYVWYNVDNNNADPSPIGFVGIEVPIQSNDTADIVAYATESAIKRIEDFKINRSKSTLRIENLNRGICTDSTDFGTGFTITTVLQGAEQLIKAITIPYDGKVKYLYNEQERNFEVVPVSSAVIDVSISAASGDTIAISAHATAIRITDESNFLPGALSTSAYTQIWSYVTGIDLNVRNLKIKADTFGVFRLKIDGMISDYYQTSPLHRNAMFEFVEDLPVLTGETITLEFIPDRIQGLANYNFFFRTEGYEP